MSTIVNSSKDFIERNVKNEEKKGIHSVSRIISPLEKPPPNQ